MKRRVIIRLVWILIFAILVYTVFVIWSDFRQNLKTLRDFTWRLYPLVLAAVLVNFVVRELKWDYYRRAGGINVPRLGSFLVFFSGYSMCISPGRVGELIKPFMYKEYFGQKMSRTVPLVFCERVSDLLGMIVLAAVTLTAYMAGVQHKGGGWLSPGMIYGFLVFSAVFVAAMIWLIRQKSIMHHVGGLLSLSSRIERSLHHIRALYHATHPLLTVKNLAVTTAMAFFSWAFECWALMIILHGVGADQITFGQATFVFCMATIFGGFLFFLPGGLGGFEATMTIMLSLLGVLKFQAVSATFLVRLSTLFFGVAIGFLFILITSAKYHKPIKWDEFDKAETEIERESP
ncbi:MAG: lysylphosphatidylglycerol synthase transmembrane domain-containing protein [bacterium]|nr:lysylphosphatidylglycerol synthase transmembrane domain-containing protein [Candidatus Sumerlaeota bacterium]